MPRTLDPSRRRNRLRLAFALGLGAFGVGALVWGAWPLGVILLGLALWQLGMAALIAFRPGAYALELDDRGFRVHDVFGRVSHDLRWGEVAALRAVNVNAYSFVVVAWVCHQRRAKRGRLRWVRGARDDDGCMPDTYAMRAERLMMLMYDFAAQTSTTTGSTIGRRLSRR
jgi:hypothetical protein